MGARVRAHSRVRMRDTCMSYTIWHDMIYDYMKPFIMYLLITILTIKLVMIAIVTIVRLVILTSLAVILIIVLIHWQ